MLDILPSDRVSYAFGSHSTYSDALSDVHQFNSRLLRERRRRLRLPFVDSETHIIQTPRQNHLWQQPTQRLMPFRQDQISTYVRKQWRKRRAHPLSAMARAQTYSIGDQQTDSSTIKNSNTNESKDLIMENDPHILVQAGDLGMLDTDIQTISTIKNPAMISSHFLDNGIDDSFQVSMKGLVQSQQPYGPQHNATSYNHHLQTHILNDDDDLDDIDYDDYRPASGNSVNNVRGMNNNATTRRQQYTLAELPFMCEYCSARYKTKPRLQYHLAKHKETNTDSRSASSSILTRDHSGSFTPSVTATKRKYMNSSIDHQQQHSMYSSQSKINGSILLSNLNGHVPPTSGNSMPLNSMNHHQSQYDIPPYSHSMPLTVAALSGLAPTSSVAYYSQQQLSMMRQQPMMIVQQQQQQQQFREPPKQSISLVDSSITIATDIQCDFSGGDEQENKTIELPEQMITCKDCGGSAYPTCLNFTPNTLHQVKSYSWQCMECKTCIECGNSGNDSELLFCDDYDRVYHMYCCSPSLSKASEGD